MPALTPRQIADIDNLTLENYQKDEWLDESLALNDFIFEQALRGPGRKVGRDGGKMLTWKIQDANLNSYQRSGLYGVEATNNANLSSEAKIDWTKQIVGYDYDVDEEVFNNPTAVRILDLLSMRVHAMWNDWFVGMETDMWAAPASSADSPMRPYGVPFWFQSTGATSTFGFNGGDPSGFSAGAGGRAVATYPRWKNANWTYATIDDDDFFLKLAESLDKCRFRSPHNYAQLGKGKPDWSLYTVYSTIQTCRKLQKAQNDDIGRDLGEYQGEVLFRRIPMVWVPALDQDSSLDSYTTTAPIYGLNWRKFHYVFQEGKEMVKTDPITPSDQPTVRKKWMYSWGNFRCYSRREGGFVGVAA